MIELRHPVAAQILAEIIEIAAGPHQPAEVEAPVRRAVSAAVGARDVERAAAALVPAGVVDQRAVQLATDRLGLADQRHYVKSGRAWIPRDQRESGGGADEQMHAHVYGLACCGTPGPVRGALGE